MYTCIETHIHIYLHTFYTMCKLGPDLLDPIILSRGPRSSTDKKSNTCVVYDAMVNSNVIGHLSKNLTELFCAAVYRHVETKYSISVDKYTHTYICTYTYIYLCNHTYTYEIHT